MKLFKYRFTPIAFLLWVFFIALLNDEVVSQSFLTKDAYIDINDGALIMRQDYLGFYLGNQKIGNSRFVLKEDSDESGVKSPQKCYYFESESLLQIEALGLPMTLRTNQAGELNEDLTLRSFTFSYSASGQSLSVLVNVEDDGLHLTTKSNGDVSESVIPHSGPIWHTDMIHLAASRKGLEVGKGYIFPVFEAMTMSLSDAVITVLAEEKIDLPSGETADTFKIQTDLKGFKSTSWIDERGNIYKEVSTVVGITSTAVRETREQAANMKFISKEVSGQVTPELDLIKASRIAVESPIENPKSVNAMTVKLIGAEQGDIVIDGVFQKLKEADGDELILDVQKLDYDGLKKSLSNTDEAPPYQNDDESLKKFVEPSPLIQSDNPQIRAKALEIAKEADAKNPWQASLAVANWLYRNIEKVNRVTIPSAVEVLSSMKGDCNEHSTLFAALGRALGIPTKICAGLVYVNDLDGGYYYHAWNEVYINGQWYPIDATQNRMEMDAAHIKLAEGSLDSQGDIIKLIGKLKVEVLSVSHE